jgi:hypothetical protein
VLPEVDSEVVKKPTPRLVTFFLTGYAFVCAILIGVIVYFVSVASSSATATSVSDIARLIAYSSIAFLILGIGIYKFARFIEAVSTPDRRLALIQFAWVYSPVVIASAFWVCGWLFGNVGFQNAPPGLGSTFLEEAVRFLAFIASITWVLVSAPIARLWATTSAGNPEAILGAEEHLFVTKKQREIEAKVSIPTYYSLLLSITTMTFLIMDATVGEMFERVTGISGFVGATVAALVVAGLLYPIRRRISVFVSRIQNEAQTSGRGEAVAAVRSAISATGQYFIAEASALSADIGDGHDDESMSQRADQLAENEQREETPRLTKAISIGRIVGGVCAVLSVILSLCVLTLGTMIVSRGNPDLRGVIVLVIFGALAWFFATTSYRLLLNRARSTGGGILPPTLTIIFGASLCLGGVWMVIGEHFEGGTASLSIGIVCIWTGLLLKKRANEAKKDKALVRSTEN